MTAFYRKEYSEENLLFWTACEKARLMEDDLEFLQQVKKLRRACFHCLMDFKEGLNISVGKYFY
jgi:hypothetical protein